jgi:capsular polysaccharide export protein
MPFAEKQPATIARRRAMAGALPLLRAPDFGSIPAVISRIVADWGASLATPFSLDASIGSAIVAARVGGMFWRPAPVLQAGEFRVVVLPPDVKAARNLWLRVLARVPAERLLVLVSAAHPGLEALIRAAGCVVARTGDPHPVLDVAREIYVGAMGDLGVLGLLARRPVFRLYGEDFRREAEADAVAWVTEGTAYADPYTGQPARCEEAVELLAEWRRIFARNREIAVCAGMSLWKRRRVAQLLTTGEAAPVFRRSARAATRKAASRGGAVAVWSTRVPKGLEAAASAQKIAVQRVEDGFIRSSGLGSDMLPPASIIVDKTGIYFDPSRPSDLETLLADTMFSDALRARAKRLVALLVARGISKYAAGGGAPVLHARPGQRIILVPGQVSDDLSVQLGAAGAVRGNAQLLAAVRRGNPDAFIVYRPHPDVDAGHRGGAIPDATALQMADQVTRDGAMAALIGAVDEVHTMTSLAGFEALLRGRRVETYGQPFYAGWGLTADHAPLARRQRRLCLEELAAAVLILYPLYVDPATGLPCGPEILIARLEQAQFWRPSLLMRLRRLQGRLRRSWRNVSERKPISDA